MKRNTAFTRKVIYFSAMAVLLYPLYYIGTPATMEDEVLVGGGILSRMRQKHHLAESRLGDIDPASETLKLATLGLRGLAVNILWERAAEFTKKEDWDNLKVTLNQIAKLQPHFIGVWQFQAWNLSYNVSTEFDDYRQRYHWVKKGIDYMFQGIRYNRSEPRLYWDLARFFGQKIGTADERVQYRRMFSVDEDFHKTIPLENLYVARSDVYGGMDNWLVSRLWAVKAERIVLTQGVPMIGISPLVFYARAGLALINYSETLEEDGYFGEKVQRAWKEAGDAWQLFGDRDIPTIANIEIRLNDYERVQEEAKKLEEEYHLTLTGKVLKEIQQRKRDQLTAEQRQALDTPMADRTAEQKVLARDAEETLKVDYLEIAKKLPKDQRKKVLPLASQHAQAKNLATNIYRSKGIVNFDYWRTRCQAEQTSHAVNAREYVYQADQLFNKGDLVGAKEAFEKSWQEWAVMFEEFPTLKVAITARDIVEKIGIYRNLLGQLDEDFPEDFILQELLDLNSPDYQEPAEDSSSSSAADNDNDNDNADNNNADAADADDDSAVEGQ